MPNDKRKVAIEAMKLGIDEASEARHLPDELERMGAAALDALLAVLPSLGLRVVPVEPDETMKQKIHFADWHGKSDLDWSDGYRIMTAAATNLLGRTDGE